MYWSPLQRKVATELPIKTTLRLLPESKRSLCHWLSRKYCLLFALISLYTRPTREQLHRSSVRACAKTGFIVLNWSIKWNWHSLNCSSQMTNHTTNWTKILANQTCGNYKWKICMRKISRKGRKRFLVKLTLPIQNYKSEQSSRIRYKRKFFFLGFYFYF